MPSRAVLERQLKLAEEDLALFEKRLDADGVESAKRRRNTKWRELSANLTQLRKRLSAVAKVEANDAAVAQRKSGAAEAVA